MFSSIGDENHDESLNFNWGVNQESQDLNCANNYLKPDISEMKYIHLEQSNNMQMMDSVEGCGEFDMSKPLLSVTNDNMKSYNMGGASILNQFSNNITPVFSINEEIGDNIRPNVLDSDVCNENLVVPSNLPPFVMNPDGDMMLTDEFKPPIGAHNQ